MPARPRRLAGVKWLICLLLAAFLGSLVATCLIVLQVLSTCPSDPDFLYSAATTADSGDWHAALCRQLASLQLLEPEQPQPVLLRAQHQLHPPRKPSPPFPPPAATSYLNPEAMPWAADDGIELPRSNEDIERIMRFPHVEECNLCRVCIPHEVVARHPKAKRKAREGMSAILDQGDLLLSPPQAQHSNSNLKTDSKPKTDAELMRLSSQQAVPARHHHRTVLQAGETGEAGGQSAAGAERPTERSGKAYELLWGWAAALADSMERGVWHANREVEARDGTGPWLSTHGGSQAGGGKEQEGEVVHRDAEGNQAEEEGEDVEEEGFGREAERRLPLWLLRFLGWVQVQLSGQATAGRWQALQDRRWQALQDRRWQALQDELRSSTGGRGGRGGSATSSSALSSSQSSGWSSGWSSWSSWSSWDAWMGRGRGGMLRTTSHPEGSITLEVKEPAGNLNAWQQQVGRRRAEGARKLAAVNANPDVLESDGVYRVAGRDIDISNIAPGNQAVRRRHLPDCQVCWGCKHTLERMASGDILLGSYYAHEPGGSPSWLFRVRTNRTDSGWAVVKVWCVAVQKVKQRGLAMCAPKKVFSQVKLLLAQQQITAKCGMNDIVPKLWIEPVHGVLPGHGFRVNWLGMWFDVAEGVSVQNIQEAGKPQVKPDVVIQMFSTKVNHTEIKLGAIFDLLFSQCDRHQQNVFMTASGQLRFIDNDQVFGTAWRKCGIDSMIVPSTQKFMINHLGFGYTMKYPVKDPGPPTTWTPNLNPLLLLDYRCHVGGDGNISTNFPAQVRQCMSDLAGMTSEQIFWQYGYPGLRLADAVRNRSRDLLEHGYEWTLLHGQPTNQPQQRYKVAPPCCNMTWSSRTKYVCTTPGFQRMGELPFGNPWHGGKWHGKPGKDTGTYEGGTVF